MSQPRWYYLIDEETWNALLVADELLSFGISSLSRTPDEVQLDYKSREVTGFCAAVRGQLNTVIGNSRVAQLDLETDSRI